MIEMHLGDDSLGDDEGDYSHYPGGAGQLWRQAFSAPALAIASLVLGLVSLAVLQEADLIGEIALLGSNGSAPSNLTDVRISALVRLVVAVIAIAMAVASGLRVVTAELDDEFADPPWVQAIAGAALIVAVASAILAAITLVYALQTHINSHAFG
jgi:hypothetical protein